MYFMKLGGLIFLGLIDLFVNNVFIKRAQIFFPKFHMRKF